MAKRPETEKEKEMFEFYWNLGDNRKIRDVAENFNFPYASLKKVAARLNWTKRVLDRDKKISKEAEDRLVTRISKDLEKRYLQMSKVMDKSAGSVTMKSFRDFRDYFETALKLKGEPEKFQIENLPPIKIVLKKDESYNN